MNDSELQALLDEAADSFSPQPDVRRLHGLLHLPRRGRPVIYGLSVAAALVFAVGGVAAMSEGPHSKEIVPGGGGESTTTVTDTLPDVKTHAEIEVEVLFPETTEPAPQPVTVPAPTTTELVVAKEPVREPRPPHATTTLKPAPAAPPTTKAPAPTAPPTTKAPATTTTHPPTTTTQPPMGFSANQTWGSCGDAPPYDEFYGTAAAGSTITVSSPYGSGSTTVKADGSWYVKVFFPTAPPYESFTVDVSSAQGAKSFSFIHTP